MKILVYCSYPTMPGGDCTGEPTWVEALEKELKEKNLGEIYTLYRPWYPLKIQKGVVPFLSRNPNPSFVANNSVTGISPEVLQPIEQEATQKVLAQWDSSEPSTNLPNKDLFCLVRSDIVLADLTLPTYGEVFQDVFLADMAKVPVIGLSGRFLNSPIMLNKLSLLISPIKIDSIIRQLVTYSLSYKEPESKFHPDLKNGDLSGKPDESGTLDAETNLSETT